MAKSLKDPGERHWGLLKEVLRYLSGTQEMGITYGQGSTGLEGWVDADYAGDEAQRKSRTGFVFLLHGGAVSWGSKLQEVTATSTAEAEYIAGASAAKEGIWLKRMCHDLGVGGQGPVQLFGDNQAALAMAAHNADSPKTKHMAVRFHSLRESVARGQVKFTYTPTQDNTADVLTKPLDHIKFCRFRAMMGVS